MTSSHRPQPILEAYSLCKTFRSRDGSETVALDHVDLLLYPGEIAALIGESGSGKTTLGRAILRLLKLDQGRIVFDQIDLLSLKGSELRKARRLFQMIFQNQQANLHPKMSVAQMLDESLALHQPHLSLSERQEQANQLLHQVGLTSHHQRYLASLSGGEQRRVGLARILATSPKLIVADEPTSGLDAAIKLQIIDLLKSLKGQDLTYLLISHDLSLVRKIADRIIVMLRGRIIEEVSIDLLDSVQHHPYTEKLLFAAELGDHGREHHDEGSIEDIHHTQQGCGYLSVCSLAHTHNLKSHCQTHVPPLVQTAEGHTVACWGLQSSPPNQTTSDTSSNTPSSTASTTMVQIDEPRISKR